MAGDLYKAGKMFVYSNFRKGVKIKELIIIFFILTSLFTTVFAQQVINGSIMHDDLQRDYILYVPENYTGSIPVPLVFNFHGFGSDADSQMNYGDFRFLADEYGFLVVHPQGTLFLGISHWNVGGWTVGSTVDDVGFTSALIDSLAAEYNIDPTRVYSTGMSNGGFMSFLLACQLSDRIAAIASVTGSMTPETLDNSDPQHPTPILQMHGTSDYVVPFIGTAWSESINDVIQYWVNFNNCDPIPAITYLPNIDPNDGSTVEYHVFDGGDNGVSVEQYIVVGGGHTWPGNPYGGTGTNYDIDASTEIWNFFSRYDINGLIDPTGTDDSNEISNVGLILAQNYPNPFNPTTTISFELTTENTRLRQGYAGQAESTELVIYNIKGQKVKTFTFLNGSLGTSVVPTHSPTDKPTNRYEVTWDGTDEYNQPVTSGIYLYKLRAGTEVQTRKMILLR